MNIISKFLTLAMVMGAPLMTIAQDYPTKPVKIMVGYVAGGSPDFVARALAQKLSDILGQPFVVENRPGGGGLTATAQLVKLPADGYTLMLGDTSQLGIAPHMFKNLPYDTFKDFAGVTLAVRFPLVIAASGEPSSLQTWA